MPTLKEKKRYLAFEIISKDKLDSFKQISEKIMNQIFEFIGTFGVSKAGVRILADKWNPKSQRGLIKVNNKHVDEIKSALCFIKDINNKKIIVKTVGVSGILKKAETRYLIQNKI